MKFIVLFLSLICVTSEIAAAVQEVAPAGATWDGSISFGAELDKRGMPVDEIGPADKTARIRCGFSATWSFSLHWTTVMPVVPADEADGELTADETRLIELTNVERQKIKLPALQADQVLMKLAREHSATMARLDKIGHDLEGNTFSKRLEQAQYQAVRAGENAAQGQPSPEEAVAVWMQSPGHKANILNADYTHIGVGTATAKSGQKYLTQMFAKPVDPQR